MMIQRFRLAVKLMLALLLLVQTSPYAMAQGRWEVAGNLAEGKAFYELVQISDEKAMFIGGLLADESSSRTVDIFDATNKSIRRAKSMLVPRAQFGAVYMPDGYVYALGGYDDYPTSNSNVVERYNPDTDQWEQAGFLLSARGQIAVAAINDKEIIVVGGRIGVSNIVASCEIYNTETQMSRPIADFPSVTSFAKAVTLEDGTIYAWSGRTGGAGSHRTRVMYSYNFSDNTWVENGFNVGDLYYPTITKVSGDLWSAGGSWREGSSSDDYATVVAKFNGIRFDSVGGLQIPRAGHGFAQANGKRLVVVGGLGNDRVPLSSCEYIDLEDGDVTEAPECKYGHGFVLARTLKGAQGPVVVVGGGYSADSMTSIVEVLDPPCQSQIADEISEQTMNLVGSAMVDNGALVLTDTMRNSAGGAWMKKKVVVAASFEVEITFTLSDGDDHNIADGGSPGGDGFAFIIQNESPKELGSQGQGLGYHGIPSGIAVEFDSYLNSAYGDMGTSHIAVQRTDGSELKAIHNDETMIAGSVNGPVFRADGTRYRARILYQFGQLTIWCNEDGVFGDPVIITPLSLAEEVDLSTDGSAWVGIVGASGFVSQSQAVSSFEIASCGEPIVSVDEDFGQADDSHFSLYPNPTSALMTITPPENVGSFNARIVDVRGSLVAEYQGVEGDLQIDTAAFITGVYAVQIVTKLGAETLKLVIQR